MSETPANLGFAAAALSMAPLFRLRPKEVNGVAVEGGAVRIPLNFRMMPSKPSALPTPWTPVPVAAENVAVASDIVGLNHLEDALERVYGGPLRDLNRKPLKDLDPTVLAAARKSLEAAQEHAVAAHLDFAARLYASQFDLDELEAWRAFLRTPAEVQLRSVYFQTRLNDLVRTYGRRQRIQKSAQVSFCSRRDCAAGPPPILSDDPDWVERPDVPAIRAAAPRLLRQFDLSAWVILECKLARYGLLEACTVAQEKPAGLGAGLAALPLTGRYRMSAEAAAKRALGSPVRVAIGFQPAPPLSLPTSPTTTIGPQALELGRQIASTTRYIPASLKSADAADESLATAPLPGVSEETRTDAIQTFHGAIMGDLPRSFDDYATAFASILSQQQLADVLAFHRSTLGRKISDFDPDFARFMGAEGMKLFEEMTTEARTGFCETYGCGTAPTPPKP